MDQDKDIVLFTAEFPYGRQETFLENELEYLSKQFRTVRIVPLFKHSKLRRFSYKNVYINTPVNNSRKVTAHKLILLLSYTFWKILWLERTDIGFSLRSLIKAIKQAFIVARMRKYLSKREELIKTDLWYFYWGTNAVNVLSFLDKTPNVVARYHRYDLYGEDVDGGESQFLQKRTLAKLSTAIFISEHGMEYIRSKYNEFTHKLVVSRLGVPYRGTCPASQDDVLRIVSCSNLYTVKRVIKIAKALKKIDSFQIEWTHVGDGVASLKKELLEYTAELPSNIKFNFLGRIKNSQLMEYYKAHPVDLFINVSISEGVPVSIMEALSFGIPVIATDVGGTGELVNGSCGELLDPYFEVTELAQSIRNFYKTNFKNENLRVGAYNTWKLLASAENNYNYFTKKILNFQKEEIDNSKVVSIKDVRSTPLN